MERITTILSLMLLEPLADRLDSYDNNGSTGEMLELSQKQQMEIEKIYEKYLNEINELLKSDTTCEERCKIFDDLTLESKRRAEKLLTAKQLKMLSENSLTA